MTSARPPIVVLAAMAVATLGLLVNQAAGVASGVVVGLALWGLTGSGLWRGQRWARAAATILGAVAALWGLAPLVALPLARQLLPDSVDLPGLGTPAVVLGVVAALLLATAVVLLWVPATRPFFRTADR